MVRPVMSSARAYAVAAAPPRLHPVDQTRNVLHLILVLAMWFSTVTPALAPVPYTLDLPPDAVIRSVQPLSAPVSASPTTAAPYRAGMAPAAAAAPRAAAEAAVPSAPVAGRETQETPGLLTGLAAGNAAELTRGLSPAWLGALTTPPPSATADTGALSAAAPSAAAPSAAAPSAAAPAAVDLSAVDLSAAPSALALAPPWLANLTTGGTTGSTPLAAPSALGSAGALPQQTGAGPRAPLWGAGLCVVPGLGFALAAPPSVSQGNTATPYTFTLVISNTDYLTPTGPLSLTLQVPGNFYFLGSSAAATSRVSGTLSVVQPLVNLAPGVPAQIVARANPETQTLPPGDVVTVTYRLAATVNGLPNPTLTNTLAISGQVSACTAAATVSTSACPLPVRLPMQLQTPPYLVSFGNTAGDIYTFTVRNTGTTTATDVSFALYPSQGFFFKGDSGRLEHSQFGALAVSQPSGDTAPGAHFVLGAAGAFPANSLAPNMTITGVLRLGTDGNAKSGQPLSVTLRSGLEEPQVCNSTRENIATGRGNLAIVKLPDVQTARFGDVVTWTVQVRNTGLGSVYNAIFDEAPGAGIQLLSVAPALTTTGEIKPDQSVSYTVTGAVNSCTDLRNEGRGTWSIGNVDATGLLTNPVHDDAYISYLFEDPAVAVAVESPGDLQFCGQSPRSLVVTVTNTGGPARALTLEVEKTGAFTLAPASPFWVMAGSVISYTANGGVLLANETVTFTLNVNMGGQVCAQNNGEFTLRPVFRHACPLNDPPEAGIQAEVKLRSALAPSLEIDKRASAEFLLPGETVYYSVTVAGRNPISTAIGPIHITDTLPAIFEGMPILRSDSSGTAQELDDRYLETVITPTTTPTYSVSLFVTATLPSSGICATGTPVINRAMAHPETCPECLAEADAHLLYVVDPTKGDGGGYFRLATSEVKLCGAAATQQTAAISVTDGITWGGTIYQDSLNAGGFVGPLRVVNGSVQVLVDDVDRTADVTVTTTPGLAVDFTGIGVYSESALITVTYQVTVSAASPSGRDIYFVHFTPGGHASPGACGLSRYAPVVVDIERANFNDLRVEPTALNACSTNMVHLSVDGNNLATAISDHLVVTFATNAADVVTVTAPYLTLGGSLAGQPVTVTTATVGASQIVSFTFEPQLNITHAGSISFPLYRPCGIETWLSAGLGYADICRVTKTTSSAGGLTTRQSNLLLRSSEITYTLNSRDLAWQFSVRNAGDMSGTNVLVTNTLPYGIHYRTVERSGAEQGVLDAIVVTTGTINPGTPDAREVVSFTVPVFPPYSSIQFVGNATVDTCNASDSLWIRLTQPCGGVGSACEGSQMARLGVQQGRGALLTSNTQQATIPLCSTGDVRLIVKNASAQADLFTFFIQEVLTDVTYVDGTAEVQLVRADGTVAAFVPFTPTLISPTIPAVPYRQTLQWDGTQMGDYDPAVQALLAQRGPSDQLIIKFRVRTYCSATSPSVQASVTAVNACFTEFRSKEDSRAVEVGRPILNVQKQVRNASEDGSYASSVFAGLGDTLVWKIDVDNSSDVDVTALFVTDTLPAWFTATGVYTTPTTNAPPLIQWQVYSATGASSPVPAQSSTTYWITGTVGIAACADPKLNVVEASYGCSDADICPASVYTAQAAVETAPVLTLDAGNTSFDQCSAGPLPVYFANTGARTGAVVVTYTLPSGYQYAGLAPGTTPLPAEGPVLGSKGELVFRYPEIGQQQVTNTLRISVTRDLAAAGACYTAANGVAKLGYADTCGVWHGDALQDSGKLTVLRPDLSGISQSPFSQTVAVGERYTWTVSVPNTGSAPARNVVVTQTIGEGLQFLTATVGASGSVTVTPISAPLGSRTVVTWEVGVLLPGETFTGSVAAQPLVAQPRYSLAAEVHAACSDGGCRQAAAATAYNTPFQYFDKQISRNKVSIGEPFSYTITADFYGGVAYTSTRLVDVLPRLGDKLIFSTTAIAIANTGGNSWIADGTTPGIITFTTAVGSITGPDSLTVRLTGIISNEVTAQQGDVFTNALALDYFDAGQRYVYSDTVTGRIKEPILNLRKLVSAPTYARIDSNVYYTLVITHALTSDATAYNVVITDAVPPAFTYAPGSLRVTAPAPGTVVSTTLGNNLTLTVTEYPTPSTPITVSFMAAANVQMQPASQYINTAYVRYASQAGGDPNDRDGSGIGPNDYWTTASASVNTAPVAVRKLLPSRQDFTVGDLVTYTVAISLPTGTTRGLLVNDLLPAGLLYLAPTSTVQVSATPSISFTYVITPSTGDGIFGSSAYLRVLDTITNNTGATAAITWTMQLLVINDPAREVNYNGATKLNSLILTYLKADDTNDMQGAVAPQVRIAEPLLHIGKEYVTALACSARLLADNFNAGSIADWRIGRGDWITVSGGLRAPAVADALLIHGPDTWSDSSYSTFFVATDMMGGDVGLVFRGQGLDNHYRFVWTRNALGAGAYQIVKVSNGLTSTVASVTPGARGGYNPNRWYHLEIRSTGRQHVVFIDAAPVLTYTDVSASALLTGSVGFYANNLSGLTFDDALVTKLGDAGCLVDANKLVTYTLTISNQERITGYNVLITDVLPLPSLQYVGYEMASSDPTAAVLAAPTPDALGVLGWRVNQLAPALPFDPAVHGQLVLTVTARVLGDVSAGMRMPNQALLTYDGQQGGGPLGVERQYSGGSHSTGIRTPDASLFKIGVPLTATIGQRLRYTLTLPAVGGLPATLYTATLTDVLPSGFRLLGVPSVTALPDPLVAAMVSTARTTTKTLLVDFTRIPSNTEVTVAFDAVVENIAANQSGVAYSNTAGLGWYDAGGSPLPAIASNPVTTTLVEPQLVVEKSVTPKSVRPGDIVFYRVRVYHAITSTAPAYNVVISDVVPPGLSYISGSWSRDNEPLDLAATGAYTEQSPRLEVYFPVISTTVDAARPLVLTFQAAVDLNAGPGTLITNAVTTTWQSLVVDPYGERRDGRGGVNDYRAVSTASVGLDSFNLLKSGPLTATAGSVITYVVALQNNSAITGYSAVMRDLMPFQIAPITGTYVAPLRSGACDPPSVQNGLPVFNCILGDLPPYSAAVITLTGKIDPATPNGALLQNHALANLTDANSVPRTLTADADTQVTTRANLTLRKTGPPTATAGSLITYTIAVTNGGPSLARSVDIKDQLPPGLSLESIVAQGGVCAGPLCQFGSLPVDSTRTVTVVARVSSALLSGVITNTVITNTAAVFSPDAPVVTQTVPTQITALARLNVTKTALNTPVNAGEVAFFQIVVANAGPSDAVSVVVTDTLPGGLTYAGGDAACTANGDKVLCALGSLAAGSTRTLQIEGRTAATLTNGLQLTNSMTATSPTAGAPVTATAAITVRQGAGGPVDLRLVKIGPTAAVAGQSIRYTLTLTNYGPMTATAAGLVDLLPQGVDFVAAAPSQGLCEGGVTCQFGDLPVGGAVTVVVTGLLQSQLVTATQIVNTAQASSANSDLTPSDNRAAYTTTVGALALLTLTKDPSAADVVTGSPIQYRIVVSNAGPSTARNIVVSDALPLALVNPLVTSSRGGCTGFPCSLGDLEPGGAATVIVAGTLEGSGLVRNTASVTSTTDLRPGSMLTGSALVTVESFADLALHKVASPTAVAGGEIVYTLTVYNEGPSAARFVTVTDALPAQTVFGAASAGCTHAGGIVTCLAASVAAGMTQTFVVTASASAALPVGSSIENRAAVAATTRDPHTANNFANADTSIIGRAALTISKQALAGEVVAGGVVTYTIVVTNSGPSSARAVEVTDRWPSALSLVAISASDGGQCASGICQLGALDVGMTRTITVTLAVGPGTKAGPLDNVASVYSPDSTSAAPVVVTATTTVTIVAGLRITKTALNNPAVAGGQQSYEISVYNDGPSDAQAVRITDTLPAGTTFAGGSAGCSAAGQTVVCAVGTLAAGNAHAVLVNVTVDSGVTDGAKITNVAVAGSPSAAQPVTASVETLVRQPQGSVVDLVLTKLATPHTTAGQGITYTLIVTNNGPSRAQNVHLVDALPFSVTIMQLSGSQGTCAAGMVCQLGDLAPGMSASVYLTGFVGASVVSGTLLFNTAQVGSSNAESNPFNNTADAVTAVDSLSLLTIDKQAAAAAVAPGGELSYRILVRNDGPSLARSVVVTDLLPSALLNPMLSSSRGACAGGACRLGDLPPGETATILLLATVALTATGSIDNVAVMTTTTALNPASVLTAAATVKVGDAANLRIHKTASAATVLAGNALNYTIVVTNEGPGDAAAVRVIDTLPPAAAPIGPVVTQRSVTQDPMVCTNLSCELGTLPPGEVITLTLAVRFSPAVADGTTLTNTATVYSATDANPADNVSHAATLVQRQSALVIQKRAAPDPAVAGTDLEYTIVVVNHGPSDADGVTVADLLPLGFSLSSAVADQGDCTQLPCTLGALPSGATAVVTIRGKVDPLAAGPLVNTATVTATTPQTDLDSSTTTISTPVIGSADLQLLLQSTPTAVAGLTATVRAGVVNRGPSAAVGAVVLVTLPPGTALAAVQLPGGWTATLTPEGLVRLATEEVLPPGADIPLDLVVALAPNIPVGSSLEFGGSVTSQTPDPNPGNNADATDTSVLALADFAVDKEGPGQLVAGALATYTVLVQNNGPSAGYLRDIKDSLPRELALVSADLQAADGGLTACAGAICQVARPLAVGEVVTMTVVAQVAPDVADGTVVTNTATVFADATTPDPREANNQAIHVAPVAAWAQLAIDKFDLIDPVYPDTLLAYVLAVTNQGPGTAAGLLVTDTLPPGVTYVGSTAACGEGPVGVVTCSLPALAPGERATFQIIVRVGAGVPNGTLLYNTAALTSTTPLRESLLSADEETRVIVPSGPLADLAVTKSAAPGRVMSGGLVTFTLIVTNNGPSPVNSAQLLDLLPTRLELVEVTPSQGFCNAGINCLLGTLNYLGGGEGVPPLRGMATVTVVARATGVHFVQQVLTNTAYVQSERQDPAPENNYAAASVVVLPNVPLADVQIEKRDRVAVSTAGGLITYTLRVFNAGPSPAAAVVVQDVLPQGVAYVSADPAPAGGAPGAPAWSLGEMAVGTMMDIRLVVRSSADAQAGLLIRNTATVTTTTEDPIPQNNASTAESQVFGTVDLEVRKTAQPTSVLPGENVTYLITVTNHGPSAARDVDIKEKLPPGMTIVNMKPSRGVCVSQICQFGAMAAGETIVVAATAKVNPGLRAGAILTNTAAGFTDTPDSNPHNNQSRAPIIVGPLVNLQVSKHAQAVTATVGTEITYTMIVTNLGPSPSPNVVLTDVVPSGFAFVRTGSEVVCTRVDRWYTVCPLGSLDAGGVKQVELVFFIEAVRPGTVANSVLVNDPDAYDPSGGGQGEVVIPTDPKGPTAVDLSRFDVSVEGKALVVTWQTLRERDTWSFRLWRNTVADRDTAELVTPDPIYAEGSGTIYRYVDTQISPDTTYYYWLQEITASGVKKEIDVVQGWLGMAAGNLYLPMIEAGDQAPITP